MCELSLLLSVGGSGDGGRGKTERGFHHAIPLPSVSAPTGKRLGGRALVLTLAKRLVSTLERPGAGLWAGWGGKQEDHSPMTAAGQPSDTHRPPSTRASGIILRRWLGHEWLL